MLKDNNLPYKGYQIEKITGGINKLLDKLTITKDLTGYDTNHMTMPIIFHKGRFIGGSSELKSYITSF